MERELARIATKAHGLVTRRTLLGNGITRREIDHRLGTGSLLRVYRGVYRVGHRAPSTEASYMAAVLACGEGALLSGGSAAHLLGLVRHGPIRTQVTAPTERRVPGIETRRSAGTCLHDAAVWHGIPVTTVARTVVDLAAQLPADELARAFHEADIRHHLTPQAVDAVLRRRRGAPGAAVLHRVLHGEVPVTLSTLESQFLKLLDEAGLPLPETNPIADGRRVDCRWPAACLTVELDGYRYHRTRHAWEQDRRREREARARGDDFRRYTYGDVFENADATLVELRALFPRHRPG